MASLRRVVEGTHHYKQLLKGLSHSYSVFFEVEILQDFTGFSHVPLKSLKFSIPRIESQEYFRL